MSEWVTIDCERVLYVDRGRDTILCDRLPFPVTLVVKLASVDTLPKGRDAKQGSVRSKGSAVGSEASETPQHSPGSTPSPTGEL